MANARVKRNLLSKVKIKGVTLTDKEETKVGVCRAYQTLLTKNGDWRLSLGSLQFRVLGEERSRSLEEPFSEDEVFEALSSLFGDKEPGPNGFTLALWHFY